MLRISHFGPVTRFDLARTLAGRGRYWTTAYLVDGMMVDTGCAFTAVELTQSLAQNLPILIVNTHTHEDHIGANGRFQDQITGLKIKAHPLAVPVLADPRHTQPLHPYRRLFWGWPSPSNGLPVKNGEIIETKQYRFQVVYTPGHSRDHLCLYEADQGWLFSGDLFVGGQDRALRAGCDIHQIITSLKTITDLPLSWLFPGSARVRQNPQQELKDKISYLEELGERITELHLRGVSTTHIIQEVCGDPLWIEWVTLGHFTRRRLVLSYLGTNSSEATQDGTESGTM